MTNTPKQRGGARPNTGGARAGAGRPATGRAVVVSVSLSPAIVAFLDQCVDGAGISRSSMIAHVLNKWAKPFIDMLD